MKRILLTLAVLAALPVATASAGELNYSYVEGGYLNTQSDVDADGVAVKLDTLEEALADMDLVVATTARQRGLWQPLER